MNPLDGMTPQQKAAALSDLPFFDVPVPATIEVENTPEPPPKEPVGTTKRGPGRPRKQ